MATRACTIDADGFVSDGTDPRPGQAAWGMAPALRALRGARLLTIVSALALGVAFIAATPQPVSAAECDAGTASTPFDDDDATNTACGDGAVAWSDTDNDDSNNTAIGHDR